MTWLDFYTKIIEEIDRLINDNINGCKEPVFRGLSNNSYKLLPTLFRDLDEPVDFDSLKTLEGTVFYNFESNSAIFHSNSSRSSWEVLFDMRHHEIPTRLIDWTGSFAIALYFALRNYDGANTPCVWILNTLKLNEKSVNKKRVISVGREQSFDYRKIFVTFDTAAFKDPIAIYPVKSHPRLIAQNSFFTVHGTNLSPLDEIYSEDVIKRFDIPRDIIPDAKKFLKLANMNEFSLFPDLDGLGRKIKGIYFPK